MHAALLIPLGVTLLAASLAGATLARDPELTANRLMAGILAATSAWALCELAWSLADAREAALLAMRLSAVAWVLLGPLCVHLAAELLTDLRPVRRLVPLAYAGAAAVIVVTLATPLAIRDVVPTEPGWGARFGPFFPVAFATAAGPAALLVVLRRRLRPGGAGSGERLQWNLVFAGLAGVLGVATLTDVVLPWRGVHVPRLGSAALCGMGLALAAALHRYGYLMLSPGAFAPDILAALRDGVALADEDGRIAYANGVLARLAGRPELAEERPFVAALLPELPEGRLRGHRTRLVRADGEAVPVEVSSAELSAAEARAAGRALVVVDLREVSELRHRVVARGRLAAVGELAGGIPHEIQEPMRRVEDCLEALAQDWQELTERARKLGPDGALEETLRDGRDLVEESRAGAARVMELAHRVRGLGRDAAAPAELADLNQVARRALRVALAQSERRVRVERRFTPLPRVRCHPQEIEQVLLNLLLNALRVLGDGGRLRIATARSERGVRVEVGDSGPGIPEHLLVRIFDPFFTTRPVGEGTGLGLAISDHLARRSGGELRAVSREGEGSTFILELPLGAEGRAGGAS